MKVFTIKVQSTLSFSELTDVFQRALSEIYEHKRGNVGLVFHCEHMEERSYADDSTQTIAAWEKTLRQMEMSDAVIVFASEGNVFRQSFDLLLISDYRILRTDCRVGFSPHGGADLPRMSLYRLVNQIGQAHARRVGLAGKTLGAEEAYKLGLIDEISDNVSEITNHALERFGSAPTADFAIRRRLILEAHALEYDNALGAYLAACARHWSGVSD